MNGSSSGLAHGTAGTQTTLEQSELKEKVSENEMRAKEAYLRDTLPQSAPMSIPNNATIKTEQKTGYEQVKYTWKSGDFEYISRWHTRTPNAPTDQTESWVVERIRHGVGAGSGARRKTHDILVGKTESGNYKWVSMSEWRKAIYARKNGTATQQQKEMLDNGHWKST